MSNETPKRKSEKPKHGPHRSGLKAVRAGPAPKSDKRHPPSKREAAEIEAACEWLGKSGDPVEVQFNQSGRIGAAHNDDVGHAARLSQAFATRSPAFMNHALNGLSYVGTPRGKSGEADEQQAAINSGLAMLGAVAPENEIETALGMHMWGLHALTVELLGRTRHTDSVEHMKIYGGLAERLQKRFTESAETLAKLRTGGKQQVEVRYVYVDARNQQLVLPPGGGGGGDFAALGQPHAPHQLPSLTPALCVPMRSPDEEGHELQVPRSEGQA